MSLRTVMQAGPAKANELFAKLSETSDGAVKTREKLFTELKAELELHTNLEEQHLFPILRRNAETKELVAEAIKDNKELRAKLAELEALPKNDEAFPERLKELQKTFRQHARDEKRELLPAVQRALSEEQVQGVAEKIEAGVAEAEQARQEEVEERRLKARQEREKAERGRAAGSRASAEGRRRANSPGRGGTEAGESCGKSARRRNIGPSRKRVPNGRRMKQSAASTRPLRRSRGQPPQSRRMSSGSPRAPRSMHSVLVRSSSDAADAYVDAARTMMPDPKAVASLPSMASAP